MKQGGNDDWLPVGIRHGPVIIELLYIQLRGQEEVDNKGKG